MMAGVDYLVRASAASAGLNITRGIMASGPELYTLIFTLIAKKYQNTTQFLQTSHVKLNFCSYGATGAERRRTRPTNILATYRAYSIA